MVLVASDSPEVKDPAFPHGIAGSDLPLQTDVGIAMLLLFQTSHGTEIRYLVV